MTIPSPHPHTTTQPPNHTATPFLDLAPRLNRPLRLWWPTDYLRLLVWVFYFLQALRWYEVTFSTKAEKREDNRSMSGRWRRFLAFLRIPTAERNLFFQGQVLMIAAPVSLAFLLQLINVEVSWVGLAFGVAFGVTVSVASGAGGDVAFGVAFGVVFGVAFGVLLGVVFGIGAGVVFGVEGGVMRGVVIGMAVGVVFSVGGGVMRGVAVGVASSVVSGILASVAGGIGVGAAVVAGRGIADGAGGGVADGMTAGVASGVASAIALAVTSLRLPEYLLALVVGRRSQRGQEAALGWLGRATWLPLPGLRRQLLAWLRQDAAGGVATLNEILTYTYQFIPTVQATNDWLAGVLPDDLLLATNRLAEKPCDWYLIRFCSASLGQAMWQEAVDGLIFIPSQLRRRWQARFDSNTRLDTPARAACAGYWYLNRFEPDQASRAFEYVCHLPYGEVLYRSALALEAARQTKNLTDIAGWAGETAWLVSLTEEPLRPQAVATLRRLRVAAMEAAVAIESVSKLNRSTALGRAGAALTELIQDVAETCPYPEWPIVKEIAEKWRDVLSLAAGEIGQQAITRPVHNPFVAGTPVQGSLFVGREEIFRRLEELWGSDPARVTPSVVLFGHRRMGKTSILQNLGMRFGVETAVASFTMQRAGRLAGTGQLLGYLALAIYDALREKGVKGLREPDPAGYDQEWYSAFNRFLRAARPAVGGRRVILTVDEFELIEREIEEGRVEVELLEFLRGAIHSEPWLVLALAGLHTLEEMTADYWNPLFASVTPVHVSFLSRGATAQLLANPSDDFPLDFSMETIDRVYGLVRGQPYLTQLIGHTLVREYNRFVFEEGRPRDPRFTAEDVDAVVASPEFYEQGSYYFSGVWAQAGQGGPAGQPALLRALATVDEPAAGEELAVRIGLGEVGGRAALETLRQHDVILPAANGLVDFAVPLMRRWIRERKPPGGPGNEYRQPSEG
ncbi:MAG: ATP-binding protein [Chloroflexi bacterium]|nr:ATP-binding protein [Chloroflexota bacterium]